MKKILAGLFWFFVGFGIVGLFFLLGPNQTPDFDDAVDQIHSEQGITPGWR